MRTKVANMIKELKTQEKQSRILTRVICSKCMRKNLHSPLRRIDKGIYVCQNCYEKMGMK